MKEETIPIIEHDDKIPPSKTNNNPSSDVFSKDKSIKSPFEEKPKKINWLLISSIVVITILASITVYYIYIISLGTPPELIDPSSSLQQENQIQTPQTNNINNESPTYCSNNSDCKLTSCHCYNLNEKPQNDSSTVCEPAHCECINNKCTKVNEEATTTLPNAKGIISYAGTNYTQGEAYFDSTNSSNCIYDIYISKEYLETTTLSALNYCKVRCAETNGKYKKYISLNQLDEEGSGYIFATQCKCDKC